MFINHTASGTIVLFRNKYSLFFSTSTTFNEKEEMGNIMKTTVINLNTDFTNSISQQNFTVRLT